MDTTIEGIATQITPDECIANGTLVEPTKARLDADQELDDYFSREALSYALSMLGDDQHEDFKRYYKMFKEVVKWGYKASHPKTRQRIRR